MREMDGYRRVARIEHPGAPICDGCNFPVPACRGYGDCDDHDLIAERDRYRAALEEIAGEDYRGNRSQGAALAYKALHPDAR